MKSLLTEMGLLGPEQVARLAHPVAKSVDEERPAGIKKYSATVVEEILEAIKGIFQELIPEWFAKQILVLPTPVHMASWQREKIRVLRDVVARLSSSCFTQRPFMGN